jgi:hypothetical protein
MVLSALIITIMIVIISLVILEVLHRIYYKSVTRIKPEIILFLGYLILIINMFLATKVYSLEWAFLGFIIVIVLFYDFKIDSRFLILPALLLLGYIPFLLIGVQKEIAESIAVFVYYFLVVGVVLQIIEHVKKIENSIDFDRIIIKIINNTKWIILITITSIISMGVIVGNRFYNLEFYKWTSVYIFAVVMVFYIIFHFQEQK